MTGTPPIAFLFPLLPAATQNQDPQRELRDCVCRAYHRNLMNQVSFDDLYRRLTPEALELFRGMAAAHLESTGDRLFIGSDSAAGTSMFFIGTGSNRTFNGFDGGARDDLVTLRLLSHRVEGRSPNYRVTGDGQNFYRWLLNREGSAIEQVEQAVQRVTSGSEYAKAHPEAAHHLHEAFELLWSRQTDEQVVSEIGDHLRKALMDATKDVVGSETEGRQEKPVARLRSHLKGLGLPSREAEVVSQIVELAQAVLSLDQRLNHIRDESDKGEPDASWEEIRRAAFTTAFTCYELDRLRNQR